MIQVVAATPGAPGASEESAGDRPDGTATTAAPFAVPLNTVAVAGGVEVTLLAYAAAGETLRVYGSLRVTSEHEPILGGVPALELLGPSGTCTHHRLTAHVVPMPPIIWLAWTFRVIDGERFVAARIEQVELGFRAGKRTETVAGPWVFEGIAAPPPR